MYIATVWIVFAFKGNQPEYYIRDGVWTMLREQAHMFDNEYTAQKTANRYGARVTQIRVGK